MVNLKNKDAGGFFLVSAVCFFSANNLHWVIKKGIIANALDLIATLALIAGILIIIIERRSSKKGVNQ